MFHGFWGHDLQVLEVGVMVCMFSKSSAPHFRMGVASSMRGIAPTEPYGVTLCDASPCLPHNTGMPVVGGNVQGVRCFSRIKKKPCPHLARVFRQIEA